MRERNKHSNRKLSAGRGIVGKTAVAGIRDRETSEVRGHVVEGTCGDTMRGFVVGSTAGTATAFTDEACTYRSLDREHTGP